jgi:hypothetical protein
VNERANFYFYFSDGPAADRAAEEIRKRGFEVEVRLGANGAQWLALARKSISDEELDKIEEQFEELGTALGGEYDGFDRA